MFNSPCTCFTICYAGGLNKKLSVQISFILHKDTHTHFLQFSLHTVKALNDRTAIEKLASFNRHSSIKGQVAVPFFMKCLISLALSKTKIAEREEQKRENIVRKAKNATIAGQHNKKAFCRYAHLHKVGVKGFKC